MVEWNSINWRKLEKVVYKLQKRIYQASNRGDVKAVRRLQKTLMNSWSARTLAVRRVTQDNAGKATAGVDGVINSCFQHLKERHRVGSFPHYWQILPSTRWKNELSGTRKLSLVRKYK